MAFKVTPRKVKGRFRFEIQVYLFPNPGPLPLYKDKIAGSFPLNADGTVSEAEGTRAH